MRAPDTDNLSVLSTHFFQWERRAKAGTWYWYYGTAEASQFNQHNGLLSSMLNTRIWKDAADVGFIVAGRTGERRLFTLSQVSTTDDHEISSWRFEQADPNCEPGCTIIIYND